MGLSHSPSIVMSGLVLALDAGNTKGFDDDENLLLYSEQFDNASWSKSGVVVSTNATTAPDGTLTAELITEDTASNSHWVLYSTFPFTTNTYTFSIFAKQGVGSRYLRFTGFLLSGASENAIFDISSGIVYSPPTTTIFKSASIIPYPNGWYRCVCNFQYSGAGQRPFFGLINSTTNFGPYSYTGDGTSGIYIWGAQLEYGSSVSPYYATTGTTKNRGTTLIDLTGNGNSGTLTNGPTYSTANGGSIVFDGVDDYVTTGRVIVPNSSSSYTVSVWCYRNRNNVGYEELLAQWTFANSNNSFFFGFDNSNVRFTDNWTPVTVPGAGNTGVWMNLVGVYSVSNAFIYLNGSLSATKGSGFSYTGTGNFITGRQGELSSEYFSGRISNTSIYNRALSAAEVSQNFNALKGRFSI